MERQQSFNICDAKEVLKERERKKRFDRITIIDRAIVGVLFIILLIFIAHVISSFLTYWKVSTSAANVQTVTTTTTTSNSDSRISTNWNLSSPLEFKLNCSNGRKIPLDLSGSKVSSYFLYLCKNKSSESIGASTTPYQKLIILNNSRSIEDAASFTWTNLDFMREYCLYCVHSVAYCKQMLKLKFYTNSDSSDCYYSYMLSSIFVCMNQKQEITRGVIGGSDVFNLSRRELYQFCEILEFWF
jgi:hypothetical protein